MAKGRRYSDAVRAEVQAAILTGQSVTEVAQTFALPKSTVSRIRRELSEQDLEQLANEKKLFIGHLILASLEEQLKTLAAQAVHFRNPDWLGQQKADDLAILHGVLHDKTLRILEGIVDVIDEEEAYRSP